MRKYINTLIFLLLGFLLPLIGKIDLLIHYKIIIMMSACIIVFHTQPPVDMEEAKSKQDTDKNSVILILLLSLISVAIPIIEWAHFKSDIHSTSGLIPGISLLVLGLGIRVWAIQTLGKFFTATVQVQKDQQVVKNGPYTLVRHPSYLGAFLAISGCAVILEAWYGLGIAVIAMMIAYSSRIKAEEATLIKSFGKQYKDYQKQTTSRLIPFIW